MDRRIDLLVAACAAMAAIACGGDDKEANTGAPPAVACPPGQFFDGQYCRMASPNPGYGDPNAPPGGPGAPGTTPPPGGTVSAPPPPPPVPVATATAGPLATPVDPAMAAAATPLLQPLASQHIVAGAQPVGSVIAAQFQQGQSHEHQIQMQPGKCYTIVAAGAPPIADVSLQLVPVLPLPGMQPVLAQDQDTGPTAVIGKKPNCFKWAFPAPAAMKLIMTVTSGQGVAAAQVYEK